MKKIIYTGTGPITMNEYKYLALVEQILENCEPFGLCMYYKPQDNERRLCFDIRDCKLVVISTTFDIKLNNFEYASCVSSDIDKEIDSGMFMDMVNIIVRQFSGTINNENPKCLRFSYRNRGNRGEDCYGHYDYEYSYRRGGQGVYGESDDDYTPDITDILVYRSSYKQPSPIYDLGVPVDQPRKQFLRAVINKNYVDVDSEMRSECSDLFRVSLLLHIAASRIQEARIKMFKNTNIDLVPPYAPIVCIM